MSGARDSRRVGRAARRPRTEDGRSWAGRRLGNYEILAALGAGGMGEVYRAKDLKLGRDVAVKVLPDVFSRDAERVARFQREARLLAALNHPNIASIHGLEESEGQHTLVLELVGGETLARRIFRGPIPVAEVLPIFAQVADGLEAAHGKGIIHRDLKPSNVAITPEGRVKLLDFGLAKALSPGATDDTTGLPTLSDGDTREGRVLGTAAYMSPEQARGQALDERTDIWSFGCCLYEALTGLRAHRGETVPDTLAAILEREVEWGVLPEGTPAPVRRLLKRCLEKDRARRLRDIADARMEIDDARREADPASGVPATTPTRPGTGGGRTRRLRRWAWVAAPILVALAAWMPWSLRHERPRDARKSVAVLPLVTLDGEPGDESFGTGLTEDIVTQLSRIPDLEVASSLSSLRYRDTRKGLPQIARELGVATLLVGKVRWQADRVRVNVELVDAATSRNLWAEAFEGPMSDIFSIQAEIARRLATRLQVELSAETGRAPGRAPTVAPEAYRLALKGRFLRNNRERSESLARATEYFEEATRIDPAYAVAWAGLGDVYHLRSFQYSASRPQPSLYEKAVAAANRALELDDTLAEAHVVKGTLLAYHAPRDEAGGEREFRRAIELDPRHANAHRELGLFLLRSRGRVQDGVDELRAATELEPFWGLPRNQLIEAYLEKGDFESAVETIRELRDLGGRRFPLLLAWVDGALQDFARTEPLLRAVVERDDTMWLRWAALSLSQNGRIAEGAALADRALEVETDIVGPFVAKNHSTAGVVALLAGEYRAGARHLERALDLSPDPVGWGTIYYSTLYLDYATLLGYARLKAGDRAEALRLFRETERHYTERIARGDTSFRARVGIAAVHALRGNREEAYRWLQQAIDAGFYPYAELERHPCFETLRGEERFRRMMEGVRSRLDERRRRLDGAR